MVLIYSLYNWRIQFHQNNIKQTASCKNACTSIILNTWPILVGYPTKTKIWLILETTLHQQPLAVGLHSKSELLELYVIDFGWLSKFGPIQNPPLGLFP